MLLVTFAVPHESRFFRRTAAATSVRILHTGIGESSATDSLRKALQGDRPTAVLSTGFAGALDPSLQVGDLIADTISSPDLLRGLAPSIRRGLIHTTTHPVDTPALKANLHAETSAHAVDMETRAIAAECARAAIPLLVLRAISDAATDPLPVPLDIAWNLQRQTPRPFRLATYLALHPGQIVPFLTFLQNTNTASKGLAIAISEIAQQRDLTGSGNVLSS